MTLHPKLTAETIQSCVVEIMRGGEPRVYIEKPKFAFDFISFTLPNQMYVQVFHITS